MNIYDVSEKAGVSIATVSRVLNGNSNVSTKTRDKVLKVMDELGYKPNIFARGLGLNSMKTIGIMCTDSSDIYLANAIYFLEHELRNNGYDSILCCTGYSLENKQKYFELLQSKRVDAIILTGSKFIELAAKDNSYIINGAKDLPIMLMNGCLDAENIYSIVCDDQKAMYDIVSSLILSGRKRILYLYTSHSYSGLNKLKGYEKACEDNKIKYNSDLIIQCPKDILAARDKLTKLYKDGLKFDAIVTSADSLAVGAVKFANLNNISVPSALNIVGYNNSILASCTDPELTSIDTKVEKLCCTTVQILMNIFSGDTPASKTVIPAELVKRATTSF